MPQKRISTYKASKILKLYAISGLNKTQISKALNISRGTVIKYVEYYEQSDIIITNLPLYSDKTLVDRVYPKRIFSNTQSKLERLMGLLPAFYERLSAGEANLKQLWAEYIEEESSGYKYSQFVYKYHEWRQRNNIKSIKLNKWKSTILNQMTLDYYINGGYQQIEANGKRLLRYWACIKGKILQT
jgi:predicted AAA+ superfamily ATPase